MTPVAVSGWLDANVLIRHLVGEPPALARQAGALLERARGGGLALRVHSLTISETVWALERRYGVPRTEIARAVGGVLQAEGIECEEADILSDALADYATLGVDFVDRHTAFGEIRGRIGWGGPGLVYFAVPCGSRSVILGVSEDGVEALGGTARPPRC